MPFTSKLSKRLALMKAWLPLAAATALAGSALLVAWELVPHPTGPTSGAVVQIVVRPDSVALDPQQTQRFRACGRTAAGDSVPATVRWSTSGGTITSSGMYTADTSANDALVTASLSTSQVSGTANVKKKRVVQILVSPASAVLAEGSAQQFTAYGRKNTGDSVSVNVSYAATGGTITQSGFYTAWQAVGLFRVTAKQNGSSLTDSSAVSVIAVPVASVAVSPASASVGVGQTVPLTATTQDANGNPLMGRVVTWVSSAPLLATVNGSGLVTGVAVGTATITGTSEGQSVTATITVTALPSPPAASVAVSPATANVPVGATVQPAPRRGACPAWSGGGRRAGHRLRLRAKKRAAPPRSPSACRPRRPVVHRPGPACAATWTARRATMPTRGPALSRSARSRKPPASRTRVTWWSCGMGFIPRPAALMRSPPSPAAARHPNSSRSRPRINGAPCWTGRTTPPRRA